MTGRTKRARISIQGVCIWLLCLDMYAAEPVVSEDRFADTLRALESRLAELEESNARLEAELSASRSQGGSYLTGMPQEDPGIADSFEELLKRSQQAEERLAKIEEGIQKDAEAAKKKKEEKKRTRSGSRNTRFEDTLNSVLTTSLTTTDLRQLKL